MDKHHWAVWLRHNEKGFAKRLGVDAVGYSQAITFAKDELNRKGYKDAYTPGAWEVVELRRLSIVEQRTRVA